MKPIRLEMTAFGPYADRQVVDFRELAEQSFFLITGPTGAGKTAMLDAICFALYGDTSGQERDARQMRSDHAPSDVVTEVTFDFALGGDLYRVVRSPEQLRASRRGDGMTKQPPKAALWKRTACTGDDDEGESLATKLTEVNDRVERLMGFTSSEFRQVVVLPQGRFRQLLTADSAEREQILQTLFSTADYRRVQEALKQRARAMEADDTTLGTRRREVLEELGADSRDALVRRRDEMTQQLGAHKKQVAAVVEARNLAQRRLADARKAAQALADLDRARAALAKIEAGADEIAARREALDRARRALPLHETLHHRDEAGKRAQLAGAKRRDVEARLNAAVALCSETARTLERERARAAERRTAVEAVHRLRALAGKSAELAAARDRHARATASAARVEQAVGTSSKRIATLEREQRSLRDELRKLGGAAGQVAVRAQALETLQAQRSTRAALEKKREALADEETRRAGLAAEVDAAEKSLAQARAELERLQQAWDAGQAGVLGAELQDGQPCPVCGSTEHPAPAATSADTPRQAQIESARGACEALDTRLAGARRVSTDAGNALASLRSEIATIGEQLGPRAVEHLDSLAHATGEAEELLAAARSAAARSESIEKRLAETDAALATERQSLAEAGNLQSETNGELGAARTVVERLEAELPADVREPDALARATAAATARQKTLDDALEAARNQDAEADKSRAALASELESATKAELEAGSRNETICARLAAALEAAGFDDEKQLRAALLSAAEIDGAQARLAEHDRALAAARADRDGAQQRASGVERPDMAALETAASQADAAHDLAVRREADLAGQLKVLVGRLERLDALEKQQAELATRYEVLGRIAKLAEGHNEPGMPFHRFVLAALLDAVLWAASERLRIMSNNRYTLRRSTERGTRRKAQGLELEVDDAYTGIGRPAATLSGGEGFLASLSLALGLADVVQQESGGIRLEAIFVDEGFGTLDPEALDLAIRALVDLQEGGRMVGIISHVPELKERIGARLEVKAGKAGSRAEFCVP